jgi:hypothetical protein
MKGDVNDVKMENIGEYLHIIKNVNRIGTSIKSQSETVMSLIPATFRPFRLALIQLAITADKTANLRRARTLVKEASTKGANVIVLPVSTP